LLAAMAVGIAICAAGAHAGEVAQERDHQTSVCVVCLAATADDDEPSPVAALATVGEGAVVTSASPDEGAPSAPSPHQLRARAPPVSS
jgi:hypothetical protein